MAFEDSLDAAEKDDIQQYDRFVRGVISSLVAVAKTSNPSLWQKFAETRVDPALAKLADSDVIPKHPEMGLTGAADLTKQEMVALQTLVRSLLTDQQTNLGLIVKAVGINANA